MATQRQRDPELAIAFGLRVKEHRLAAGMTQEQLAEAAELHPTFISNVERGYRMPTIATLIRIARGLGVEPGVLMDDLAR
jgi:transcriptional regulator with XRE-family HTH domain